ncbi:MAG: hypothetical protein GXP62_04065 [Oligoflexia bacterium]|nr:hypothetical protein [Oligoflexia bacterium]
MLKRKNSDFGDSLTAGLRMWSVAIPWYGAGYIVGSKDLTTVQAGSIIVPTNHWVMPALNMQVNVIDSDNTASVKVRVRGLDQFRQPIHDDITCAVTAGGSNTTYGQKVFMHVGSIEILAISGVGAGDKMNIAPCIAAGQARVGLPMHIKKADSKGIQQAGGSDLNTIKNAMRNTSVSVADFTIIADPPCFQHTSLAGGDKFYFQFGPPFVD